MQYTVAEFSIIHFFWYFQLLQYIIFTLISLCQGIYAEVALSYFVTQGSYLHTVSSSTIGSTWLTVVKCGGGGGAARDEGIEGDEEDENEEEVVVDDDEIGEEEEVRRGGGGGATTAAARIKRARWEMDYYQRGKKVVSINGGGA